MNWASHWKEYILSQILAMNWAIWNAQVPWWTVCHIVYTLWYWHIGATLISKLQNSDTISQAILMWNLGVSAIIIMQDIVILSVQCSFVKWHWFWWSYKRTIVVPAYCGIITSLTWPALCHWKIILTPPTFLN